MIETSYIARYSGVGQFGPAYRYMLENDSHAAGSVDRVLQEGMIRLCAETADCLYGAHTPLDIKYRKGSRPELEQCVSKASAGAGAEKAIERIAAFTAGLQERVAGSGLDDLLLGGTEEEILNRGSDWCTDVARVGCVLCQIARLPSRLVNLFDTGSIVQRSRDHRDVQAGNDGVRSIRRPAWCTGTRMAGRRQRGS